jgi:hypothetical protein
MASLENYRRWVQQVLSEYAQHRSTKGDVEIQTIFDVERDHYQLMYIGWENRRRVFGPVMHIDIKGGKIWIQWNGTEEQVADDLMALGVSREDIVLGFHPPHLRKFTEFAVS